MSLEIDWSLLTNWSGPSASSLSSTLISTLNTHLASTSRPSFIGPISIAAFDFGSTSPSIEIRDIRDVWRAFDEDEEHDEDGYKDDSDGYDDEGGEWGGGTRDQSFDSYESYVPAHVGVRAGLQAERWKGELGSDGEYEVLGSTPAEGENEDMDDNISVYSGMSPRHSVAALGVGMCFGLGSVTPSARHIGAGGGAYRPRQPNQVSQSYRSFPHTHSPSVPPPIAPSIRPLPIRVPHQRRPRPLSAATHQQPIESPSSSPLQSPPTYPSSSTGSSSSVPPSLQLHVHISHTSDLTLTLLTSLQVNYPSSMFMSLPLRLCVTGLAINADLVLAYANSSDRDTGPETRRQSRRRRVGKGGENGRVHICLTDEDPSSAMTVGQRIIPHVQIESEIGDGDVHVLRNVGKVERFIVEALRKTIVDELVFPNFHTVVL